MSSLDDISKEQLISLIHFLKERDKESKKENEALKELLMSLRAEHKEETGKTQSLLKTIETLTQQVSEITNDNMKQQQRIDELLR